MVPPHSLHFLEYQSRAVLRSFEAKAEEFLEIADRFPVRKGIVEKEQIFSQHLVYSLTLYRLWCTAGAGVRSIYVKTPLAELARRKERDKRIGWPAENGDYPLLSGIPSLLSLFVPHSASPFPQCRFPLSLLTNSDYNSSGAERASVVRQSVSWRVINQSSSRTCETRSEALARLPCTLATPYTRTRTLAA